MPAPAPRLLLSIDDLTPADVRRVLALAGDYRTSRGRSGEGRGPVLGLLFLSPSLRTRAGFAAAAARLGGSTIEVVEGRGGTGMSAAETYEDTLRTLSGMVDFVVSRVPFPLERSALGASCACPFVNGGDGSGELVGEHPSQALLDLFAIEQLRGPVDELRVGVCGDLGSRCARSLVKLLGKFPPRELLLVAPPARQDLRLELDALLASRTQRTTALRAEGLDVLYLVGLPEGSGSGALGAEDRRRYALTPAVLAKLPESAVVLSPMPVIDEIDPEARTDPRVRIFEQSDLGVALRMALVTEMLADADPGRAAVS